LERAVDLLVVVDRLKMGPDLRDRVADSVGTAFREGEGEALVILPGERDEPGGVLSFTERFRCPEHPDEEFPEPSPQLFSFNSPYGSCAVCSGFGATLEYDEDLIVPNPGQSIDEGAVDPWTMPRYRRERAKLRAFAERRGVSVHAPWGELSEDFREAVLRGTPKGRGRLKDDAFQGVLPFLRSRERKRYKQYIRVFLRRYQSPRPCSGCGGGRVRAAALNVRVDGRTIAEVCAVPLEELTFWLAAVDLDDQERAIAATILEELQARVSFLIDVGLGYLTLDRQTRSLSGGEAQRISLANSLGSSLVDTIYVLDEPSIGLHPRDTAALLRLLARLRERGNTVLIVEHDPQAIRAADHIVELGPASGERGGSLVYQGDITGLLEADTVTGRYLSGREGIAVPAKRRRPNRGWLEIRGARLHNVRNVDLELPLATLVVVTGVSGSGKSTLVHDIVYRALERELAGGKTSAKEHLGEPVGEYASASGLDALDAVVLIDQSPIGRTPRSNPVTYIGGWDEVRRIFSAQPLSRQRGYEARHFSFNVPGGRCEACKGAGRVEVEMVFMADVYVPCDECSGTRFRTEVREVEIGGKSVADVLDLTVDEAIRFFFREKRLGETLWHLQQVGLGYLRLGQAATTLSGGEAQRLKIARELAGAAGRKGRTMYILDEPTTGLAGVDVGRLLEVLQQLVSAGNTVVVIEHNLDVVKCADWVVDMGPGAGTRGGSIVVAGPPEVVAATAESVTGEFLRDVLPTPVAT
jgi:excinuclease ABC subunit A